MQKKLISDVQEYYFYYKNNKSIVPCLDDKSNEKAKLMLNNIYNNYKDNIPKRFISQWDKVKLYDPNGNIDSAHAIILDIDQGAYDIKNSLNYLTGKEWTKFTCSWFVFNALQKDLKEEQEICENCVDHPATYSPTMIEDFILFFTKEGMKVIDPFAGIGSTLVACKRTNRIGYGTELNKKYYDIILKRVPEFYKNIYNADARNIKELYNDEQFNFCISSPPYWDVLNRSTDGFKKTREGNGLDVKYSDLSNDLGNIADYDQFVGELTKIYLDIFDKLVKGAYIVIIVKNIKKGGKLYPLAWDLAKSLSNKYVLKDEKIWIQDKIQLSPYGYPYSWASNILHHYCIILKKEV
ncbi:putative DNA methylase [Methanocella paludicola SANAE]|uniref:Type II methyltransferase n=1 Tax=Methanocella paludicola (strain DSM 17711 / JCM 13418 / NBRC 101707 / SANAE) TaxID=304371 RepID=D1YX66_METPS|nr:DNA methyltransferase [Methanocella paludicola]BAI61038.1 putative DNA methylase [Methanocella paludicola SANAE]